jgi:hypothetical protein
VNVSAPAIAITTPSMFLRICRTSASTYRKSCRSIQAVPKSSG